MILYTKAKFFKDKKGNVDFESLGIPNPYPDRETKWDDYRVLLSSINSWYRAVDNNTIIETISGEIQIQINIEVFDDIMFELYKVPPITDKNYKEVITILKEISNESE